MRNGKNILENFVVFFWVCGVCNIHSAKHIIIIVRFVSYVIFFFFFRTHTVHMVKKAKVFFRFYPLTDQRKDRGCLRIVHTQHITFE